MRQWERDPHNTNQSSISSKRVFGPSVKRAISFQLTSPLLSKPAVNKRLAMLILLRCGSHTHMYECSSYSNLKAIAFDAFNKFIAPGNEIGLQYTFRAPVDGLAEKEVLAFVNSQSCFDTFLKVWDEFVKPKQIQQQEHILPVLEVVQTAPVVVPESPPTSPSAVDSQLFARTKKGY